VRDYYVEWIEDEDIQAAFPQVGDYINRRSTEEPFPDMFLDKLLN